MTKYLNRKELVELYPVPTSRPGLRLWVVKEGFPEPVYANPNTPIWKVEEVDAWFENLRSDHKSYGGKGN